uniref:Uncharacterized protein n=1 Tax=Romanomermis culicivorax TaxID=13658 RepID=A0A915J5W1_ROMCU
MTKCRLASLKEEEETPITIYCYALPYLLGISLGNSFSLVVFRVSPCKYSPPPLPLFWVNVPANKLEIRIGLSTLRFKERIE